MLGMNVHLERKVQFEQTGIADLLREHTLFESMNRIQPDIKHVVLEFHVNYSK